jgi:hypothetical protein
MGVSACNLKIHCPVSWYHIHELLHSGNAGSVGIKVIMDVLMP